MDRNKVARETLMQLVADFKNQECMDCHIKYPSFVMELDHRDPTQKYDHIGKLVQRANRELLINELAKCDPVCANCHRFRSASRGEWVDRSKTQVL